MATLYPTGYGRSLLDIDALFARHHVDKMHPEYARRLRAWIVAQGGHIGIGGSWRDTGSQPDKPGFAPEGKSFHQYQRFASGLVAFAAVDLVARNGDKIHRAPYWSEVPEQGGTEAAKWGVHCNIDKGGNPGAPGTESWHMQPIEIDGWATWMGDGSPDPVANYPLPTDPDPEEPDMARRYFTTPGSTTALWRTDDNLHAYRVEVDEWVAVGTPEGERLTLEQARKFTYGVELGHDLIGLAS
jgi:hypothetical protein